MRAFTTFTEARTAGFTTGSPRTFELYKGCTIKGIDTSGPSSIGCEFGIVAIVPPYIADEGEWAVGTRSEPFARTESVYFEQEKNKIHQFGCFAVMWSRERVREGVEKARAWIDTYYRAHLDALRRYEEDVK